jgi:iron(II)-dependent oxidoreductase
MHTAMQLKVFKFTLWLFIFLGMNLSQAQIATSNLGSSKAMALVPEGPFTMGSNTGPDDEKPAHTLSVKCRVCRVPQ